MLNSFQTALYQRLQDFELDNPNHEFGFTRHLMKSHGWPLNYARRAIAEYKKFAFLTVVATHQVVPSDQVDQVWHAHVLLTQSYWEEFCPQVLGQPLHHHPARGGRMERAEFHHLYRQTIASYRLFFGAPPTDIWSPADRRFGAELKMQRINLSEHWVIPKRLPQLRSSKPLITGIMLSLATFGCSNVGQKSILGVMLSDLITNPAVITFGISLMLGLVLRYIIRMPSHQPQKPQLDPYEMAYLVGGSARAVELAITQLVHQGNLRPNVRNRTFAIAKVLSPEATPLEQQVMSQVCKTPELKHLRQPNKYQTLFLHDRLAQKQLLLTGWAALVQNSFGAFLLITVGGSILIMLNPYLGLLNDSVILGLTGLGAMPLLLWCATGIITFCCSVLFGRTRWGSRVLKDIRKNHDVYDVAQRFAIWGEQSLSGGALDELKQIFKAEAEANAGGCGCGC